MWFFLRVIPQREINRSKLFFFISLRIRLIKKITGKSHGSSHLLAFSFYIYNKMKDKSLNENKYNSFDHPSIERSILKIYETPKLKRD